MANLPTPKVITTTITSQFCYYFEIDVQNMRINVKAYDRDANNNPVPNTMRETGWLEMMDGATPNLPETDWSTFGQAMPLVTALVVAFGKQGNVIDIDAEAVIA